MPGHDLIVVGASAGGVEAVSRLVKGLPPDLPAAVVIVLHLSARSPSLLNSILARAGTLPVRTAVDGDRLEPGCVYVPVPDHHLVVDGARLRVVRGPKENHHRPSVDVLFRSAARSSGPRTIAVVLSGMLDDGAIGVAAIKRRGGLVVVQEPADATFADMPRAALQIVDADHTLPVAQIPELLSRLTRQPAPLEEAFPASAALEIEDRIARQEESNMESERHARRLRDFLDAARDHATVAPTAGAAEAKK